LPQAAIMKLISILIASALALLPMERALSQGLQVNPDGSRSELPPQTKREKDLGLEGKPLGQNEQASPDEDMLIDEPDENLDDETLPPTPPVSPSRP
jgi:hypothetical protein